MIIKIPTSNIYGVEDYSFSGAPESDLKLISVNPRTVIFTNNNRISIITYFKSDPSIIIPAKLVDINSYKTIDY